MDDFESFTRDKIARLRADADALEKILKEFQGTKARQAGASRRSGDQPRAGAFGVILEAILGAGAEGMTLDGMMKAAELEGYEVKRGTLRAQLWKAKEEGTLSPMEPGRYRSSTFDDFADVNTDAFVEAPALHDAPSGGFQRAAVRRDPITGERLPPAREEPPETKASFTADLDDEIPF